MTPDPVWIVHMRGATFQRLVDKAAAHAGNDDPDQDIADAISRARYKRVGGGLRFYVRLTKEQGLRMAAWVSHKDRRELRDLSDYLAGEFQIMPEPDIENR